MQGLGFSSTDYISVKQARKNLSKTKKKKKESNPIRKPGLYPVVYYICQLKQ